MYINIQFLQNKKDRRDNMIKFVFGNYSSGKTTHILNEICEDSKKGIHSFLIVPDQETLQMERRLLSMQEAPSPLNFEVLGFSRLYNRVCREYGGIAYSYITEPMRYLFMWKTLRDLRGTLQKIESNKEITLEETLISTVNELKINGISADALEEAALEIKSSSPELSKKAIDIAKIYSYYTATVNEKYSDSADDLSLLRDMLDKHDFFKNSNVYIDSFTSFTAVQHQIIERMFKNASNVTVTVPVAKDEILSIDSKSIKESFERLNASANKFEIPDIYSLPDRFDTKNNSLRFLTKNLWNLDVTHESIDHKFDSNVILESCDTPYAEAEAVCVHIRKLLSQGERCKDITVITRDAESYKGIIDQALTKSGIPFYFAENSDLCSSAAIKFILSALRIKLYNWQKNDVISHIKTGLCDINVTDGNLFEEYVNTWDIKGSCFFADSWDMNPDGLTSKWSDRGKEILDASNRVRAIIVPPLQKFFILLDNAKSVDEMCHAAYTFLLDTRIEEKLINVTEKAALRKDLKAIQETSRIFEIILNSLADIGTVLKGESASTEEFVAILLSVFKRTPINTIPTSIDEITIGSADMLRTSNSKYAFVLGLCESKFPAVVKDNGFFSFADKNILSDSGIVFNSNAETRSSDELMFVKRSFSTPSEKLFAFTHKADVTGSKCFKSLAFLRIEALFNIEAHDFTLSDFEYGIPAPKNAAMSLNLLKSQSQKNTLIKALSPYISGIETSSKQNIKTDSCSLNTKITNDLQAKNTIRLSPTAFESYAKCPFNYFCTNTIALRDKKVADFGIDNVGLFIHKILENIIKYIFQELTDKSEISDDKLLAYTEKTTKEYLESICPTELLVSKRLSHLYNRLEKLSLLITKNIITEFSDSDFFPAFFELKIDGKGNNPKPLEFTLSDGCKVTINGTVDRVDLYKKDSTVYVRIVDYKTGSKNFSLDDLQYGLNTQMLLYLYTICKNSSRNFISTITDNSQKDIQPAGIIYLSSNVKPITTSNYQNSDIITQEIQDSFERSGLLLSDEEILTAMSHSLDSKLLLGTKRLKAGNLSGKSLVSADHFDEIYQNLNDVIIKISTNLHNGVIDAKPVKSKNSPCEYCKSKPICRNVQK